MAELWDLYDENRAPLGRTVERGKQDGCAAYHVVVVVAVKNSRGEFLITLRDKSKEFFGGYWEFTGGSALAGETSEAAALREAKEETGIDHRGSRRTLIHSFKRIFDDGKLGWHGDFWDLWLFEADFPIESVVLPWLTNAHPRIKNKFSIWFESAFLLHSSRTIIEIKMST